MIRYAFFAAVALLLIGCASKNEVKITNIAGGSILVNFRAETHTIPPAGTKTISGIPNGTYDYSTTYVIPAGYKGAVDGDAAAGTFIFEEKDTQINMIYSSSINTSDTTYTLHCTRSSTRNLNSTSITSTE
ncbi:MAG: hypothetical protein ACM31E_06900 [Fibrobacterota bacterium]|nr:hypothetical protein [Chitinispirillaceae bacterium]